MKAYITKLATYLPERIEENVGDFYRKKVGIESRHICDESMTASDMALKAADKLFGDGVDCKSVDYIILCTQSPDYIIPTTACILQNRLGLSKNVGAIDVNLACSGYVYSLGLAKGLIETGQAENVLLLTAETYSKYISPDDHATLPLFGDAATATLISGKNDKPDGMYGFVYGSDGEGAESFIIPAGGARHPYSITPLVWDKDKFGNKKSNRNINMNGLAITNMVMVEVPRAVHKILESAKLTSKDIDMYIFHQANQHILEALKKNCGLSGLPFYNNLKYCGNTVSNSIPLVIYDLTLENRDINLGRVMLLGYGAGFSWGGCIVDLNLMT